MFRSAVRMSDRAPAYATSGGIRVQWIDVARGLATILVVFGHVWRGLFTARLIPDGAAYHIVDSGIYLFHMPLFFLVSGMFFERGVRRAAAPVWLMQRIEALLYPLLLWSYIAAGFLLIAGHLSNRGGIGPMAAVMYPFYPPRDIYWFLWAMFQIQLIALGLARIDRLWAHVVAFMAASLLLLTIDSATLPLLVQQVAANLPYFLLGMILPRVPNGLGGDASGSAGMLASAIALVWIGFNPGTLGTSSAYIAGLAATLGFCYAIAWACTAIHPIMLRPIAFLGSISMTVYVSHVIAFCAARLVLLKLGVAGVAAHLAIETAAGLGFPVMLYIVARRTGSLRLLGLGRNRAQAAMAASGSQDTTAATDITIAPSATQSPA